MRILTENGYEFYKNKDCWEPIEAASIVSGIDPDDLDYANLPDMIKKIYENCVLRHADFDLGTAADYVTKEITNTDRIKILKRYCPVFCFEDDVYNCLKLLCFNPRSYVGMIIESGLIRIHPSLKVYKDGVVGLGYFWVDEPDWNPHIANSEIKNKQLFEKAAYYSYSESYDDTPQAHFGSFVEKDPEVNYLEEKIYEGMKKLTLWTLDEGIKLLIFPKYVHMTVDDPGDYIWWYSDEYFVSLGMRWLPIVRAIQSDTLKVIGFDEKNKELDTVNHVMWHNNFGRCKVSPFDFLEFVKKYNLFNIPPELEWVKEVSGSGEVQYFWKRYFEENNTSKSLDPISNVIEVEPIENNDLTGKEKQELGRLRSEKIAMEASVKAAIEVGRFIQQKAENEEKIIRREIEDLVYKIDRNLPNTRTDFIWKCVPDNFKKGGGRPKKDK